MKRVVVIILVLLFVAGGGAGGLIMLGVVPNPFTAKVELSAADAAAAAASKKKMEFPTSGLQQVKLPDMTIPVIIDGRVNRRVFVIARLIATTADTRKEVVARLPAYEAAVLNDFVTYFQTYFVDHDALDLHALKGKLVAHAHTIYGDEVVKDVLLVNLFEQPATAAVRPAP